MASTSLQKGTRTSLRIQSPPYLELPLQAVRQATMNFEKWMVVLPLCRCSPPWSIATGRLWAPCLPKTADQRRSTVPPVLPCSTTTPRITRPLTGCPPWGCPRTARVLHPAPVRWAGPTGHAARARRRRCPGAPRRRPAMGGLGAPVRARDRSGRAW